MTKLNLGCGERKFRDYINIDIVCNPDRVFDLTKPLDYEPNSVEVIQAIHLFEHLPRVGLEAVVKSWYDCLIPDGLLVMEMPDFEKITKILLASQYENQTMMEWIFGEQSRPGQNHYWGWTPKQCVKFLEKIGFRAVQVKEAEDNSHDKAISFRVEAIK